MADPFARVRVTEAMRFGGTATRVGFTQDRHAIEAEFGAATATQHFVTLNSLPCLLFQVALRNGSATFGALFAACGFHPALKACLTIMVLPHTLPAFFVLMKATCIFLARLVAMERLCPTLKTRCFPAHGAMKTRNIALLQRNTIWATRSRTAAKVSHRSYCQLQPSGLQLLQKILRKELSQSVLWNGSLALRAWHIGTTFCQPDLGPSLKTTQAIGPVAASERGEVSLINLLTANFARGPVRLVHLSA
mmetsp:Transcript_42868/g.100563  ORF Transcript_42868/g.100563 Transcript_42868/m.100563 type:complete len:249 (-) Transcript_42868:693-1439(-)